ncbi:MAG: hypothetical protein SVX38_16485, partial [Chloroflexota bacterium]|nr:hypothetical protein [Chloroflexota bacterium]
AETREEACRVLADLMRDKALDRFEGPGYQLVEIGRINRIFKGGLTMKKGFALAAIVTLVIAVSTVAFVPSVRAQVAAWLGFGFEQQETLPPLIVKVLDRAPWDMPGDASFEMFTFEIPEERWARFEGAGFSTPQRGTRIPLPNGNTLPVPGYLPEGYRWQGVAPMQDALMALGFSPVARQSEAGGGYPLPPYDPNVVNYLIGGNCANQLLLLAQFKGDLDPGLLFQAYHVISPAKQPPAPVEDVTSDSPLGIVPTPTPGPSFYAAKTQVGLVIQPAEGQEGLVFLVGPGELHETSVGGRAAWWYAGTWNAAGEWVEHGTINLIWEQDGLTYQLTGQELALEELMHVAESLK